MMFTLVQVIHILESSLASLPSEVLFFILKPTFFVAFNSTSIASVQFLKTNANELDLTNTHALIPSPTEAKNFTIKYQLPRDSVEDNLFINRILAKIE